MLSGARPVLHVEDRSSSVSPIEDLLRNRSTFAHVCSPASSSALGSDWTLTCSELHLAIEGKRGVTSLDTGSERILLDADPLRVVEELLDSIRPDDRLGLPFAGGLVGFLGYELFDPPDAPRAAHGDLWLGLPRRYRIDTSAGRTIHVELRGLPQASALAARLAAEHPSQRYPSAPRIRHGDRDRLVGAPVGLLDLRSATGREGYLRMVERCRGYIAAGDIYQANLAHRLWTFASPDERLLFARMLERHRTPHAAFIDAQPLRILGNSPELFLRRRGAHATIRPIKGTRRRSSEPAEDARLIAELESSDKENAEHVMIVDLERNDLGRVAEIGTVRVPSFASVESFGSVHHLVSTVECDLEPGVGFAELIRATFPCGSITGAPKIRARQIIRELEGGPRGVYTGATGWIDSSGDLELAVAIRTAVVEERLVDERGARCCLLEYHSGAGIVADSDPEAEWQETLLKARVLQHALDPAARA